MGDPKKSRRKFQRPGHPWRAERIASEGELVNTYGLKNKKEVWRTQTLLKRFKNQAKKLIAATGTQAEIERTQLIGKLARLGLVSPQAGVDDVLGLPLSALLDRRLQTLVHRKNLATSTLHARQLISHEHIAVAGKTISAPGYIVPLAEEPGINYVQTSALQKPDHPARAQPNKAPGPITTPTEKTDAEKNMSATPDKKTQSSNHKHAGQKGNRPTRTNNTHKPKPKRQE